MKLLNTLPFSIKVLVAKSRLLALITGTKFWGLNNLDKKVVSIIGTKAGFFVEIGANDGISQSNTKYLELFHGWRGVLIEPHPGNFKKLSQTRSGENCFENAACVSFDFPSTQMELTYSNLMTTPMEGYSDLEDRKGHAEAGRKWLRAGDPVSTFFAKARTLTSVLDDAGAPATIDFMSLDVEGGEIEVLEGVNHEKYRFTWMLVESRSERQIVGFLSQRGYVLYKKLSQHDYLFKNAKN
jgi:FkbM family methyltransferase